MITKIKQQCQAALFILSLLLISIAVFYTSSLHAQTQPIIINPDGNSTDAGDNVNAQQGEIINDIIVNGIQRIEYETILSLMNFSVGGVYNRQLSNNALKKLYQSGLFDDVVINYDKDKRIITVTVQERPLINRVVFEGNDGIIDDLLKAETKLKPRSVFSRDKVQEDVNRLKKIYERTGRFITEIEPKIIRLPQNRLDLVYEITEGPVTKINKITFVGNDFVDDNALKDVIASHEDVWYRFLSNLDRYDPERINFDGELLRRFYLTQGFIDFKVSSSIAELDRQESGFLVTFTIDEGARFKNGSVTIESEIDDVATDNLYQFLTIKAGEYYNVDDIGDSIEALKQELGAQGYGFIDIQPNIKRDNDQKIVDILLTIKLSRRLYVERVEIRGNVRTKDEVVRREISLVEGDAYDATRLAESRANIQSLRYFSKVTVNNVPGSAPDQTIVDIAVQEQTTGELNVGAGYSSGDGALASFGIKENNLVGSGVKLALTTSFAEKNQIYDISLTDPYFLDKNLSASFGAFSQKQNLQSTSGYKQDTIGLSGGIGYKLFKQLRQNISLSINDQEVHSVTTSGVKPGETLVVSLTNSFDYESVNNRVRPTEGVKASISTSYAGLGGDVNYMRNILSATYYVPWTKKIYSSFTAEGGGIFSLDHRLLATGAQFTLGNQSFRGFDDSGVGPRNPENGKSTGAKSYVLTRAETFFPSGLPEELGIMLSAYTDIGGIGDSDTPVVKNQDSFEMRASAGLGINWKSPVGPMRFDLAKALVKEKYDKTKTFNFNLGVPF